MAANKNGRPFPEVAKLRDVAASVGFVDICVREFKWPSNCWPRDEQMKLLGAFNLLNVEPHLEGFALALFTRVLGWGREETCVYLSTVRKELKSRAIHAYWPV